ncbi:MAG: radical SAM protein [Candidatus Thermoplasmatota archaeon]|nr:radical SAM protein [Candidatus Thermoplasmatota archaeon]
MDSIEEYAGDNGFNILEMTKSVDEFSLEKGGMPETLTAAYVEKDGIVYLLKQSGTIERIGTKEYWNKIMKFKPTDRKVAKINTNIKHGNDLVSCGLCDQHKDTTALLNVVVTNRCDLRCWYCFFYEEKAGFAYEPDMEDIINGIKVAREYNGYTPPIQITGGEPSLRDDLDEIIRASVELGSPHVQLNTNSISIGIDYFENHQKAVEKVTRWRKAGLKTIYTSFDSISPDSESNPKNHYEIPFALQAYIEGGIKSVVLVPTASQLNLKEMPGIIKFAMHNMEKGIKGINFQPISLVGYIKKGDRDKLRVVQSDIVKELKGQFNFGMEAWYPVPTVASLADVIGKEPHIHFYNNEKCGIATYVYVDKEKNKLIPITQFIDVDKFIGDISKLDGSILKKVLLSAKIIPDAVRYKSFRKAFANKLLDYITQDELPNGEKVSDMVADSIIKKGDYSSLRTFHHNFIFMGMMHFQDYYNYDVNRVQRCNIHYSAGPKIIPFCTYNVFPSIYRDKFLEENKIEGKEGKMLMAKSLKQKERVVSFRKKIDEIVKSPIYKEVYNIDS